MLYAHLNSVYHPTPIAACNTPCKICCATLQRSFDKFLRHNNRIFIHHPAELPISYRLAKCTNILAPSFEENSFVGLSFESNEPVQPGTVLDVAVGAYHEDYEFQGQVVWTHRLEQLYQLGLCFNNERDAFRARMIEQTCYIEIYRRSLCEIEGRTIGIERAAREWIEKYSAQFPKLLQDEIEEC